MLRPVLMHAIGGTVYRGSKPLVPGSQPTWSPDGSQVAFVRGRSVWIANADGGGRRAIGRGIEPAWTPGGALAYVQGGTIVLNRRRILKGHHLSFSPDGRLTYDRDGSVVAAGRRLTLGTDPAWSPNGRAIAFVRDGNLYSIGTHGHGETELVTATATTWIALVETKRT